MSPASLLELAAGAAIVGTILVDVFQNVVVPRPTPTGYRPARVLVGVTWPLWRRLVGRRASPAARERALGLYAPAALVALLGIWLGSFIVGFALLFHALGNELRPPLEGFDTALYFAATSFLTIGFGDVVAVGGAARIIAIFAAACGLVVVALTITFLFSLFAAFGRREVQVVTLDARAGAPPSGVALLETSARLGLVDDLGRIFVEWERWSAEVLESHIAYPLLAYFRSTHDSESWVGALGAVLDAATLLLTTVEDGPRGAAHIFLDIGSHLVEDVAGYFKLHGEHEVGVERAEFDAARDRLAAAGYRLRPADAAWRDFAALRLRYASDLAAMAAFWAVPPAQWIGDRTVLRHAP